MKKIRLDLLVTQLGHFDSREKAKRAIMAGVVLINGQIADKPGMDVPEDSVVTIKENPNKYVSRGGLKLEKAMINYGIDLTNKICMDIGASTGGFTDCMLKSGATKVFSVDVGYGQLDYSLRTDERVVNMERTNIRHVTLEQIVTPLDFVSIDVSFISLKLVLPVAYSLMNGNAEIVFLIKPQFEAGREQVGKHGVVRDERVHVEVLKQVTETAMALGFILKELTFSPIRGPKGNIEFLCYAQKRAEGETTSTEFDFNAIVKRAHLEAE